jgi:hypothetical protein
MWTRLRGWIALGSWFLLTDAMELRTREFAMGWAYYVTLWGYLALCILAGVFMLTTRSIGRWLVTSLAVLLAIYAVLLWGKAEGAALWFQAWCVAMGAFAIWSICLVQRRTA